MIDACNVCPDNLITVYNCEGMAICEFGGKYRIAGVNTCLNFDKEATDKTIIYEN